MKKISKKTLILSSIVILIPIIIGCVLWDRLPDTIPTHFAMDGTPNGWSSKPFTVFGMPVFLLIIHLLCLGITSLDPKYDNISNKIYNLVVWICPVISWLMVVSCYGAALGATFNMTRYGMIGTGILFIVIGNYLPKCKQNYTMGIKIPWTLDNEENWNYTHRMAGFLWVIGGFGVILNAFLEWIWLFFIIVILMSGIPMVYSYLYYKKKHKK